MDAIKLLEQDHAAVVRLLSKLISTRSAAQQERLLAQAGEELKALMRVEEELFYPQYQDTVPRSERHAYYEAREEHHVIDIILSELQDVAPASVRFKARASVLKGLVEHHFDEEKRIMHAVKRALSAEELKRLGESMQQRKEQLTHSLDMDFGMARTQAYAARRWR